MKKIIFGFGALAAITILTTGCPKKKPNVEPVPDKEFGTSVDAVYATALLTEVDDIVAHYSDGWNINTSKYFVGTNTLQIAGNATTLPGPTPPPTFSLTYNPNVVCLDGKRRSGTIGIDWSATPGGNNTDFYREPGYVAKVTFNNFMVDGIAINNTGGTALKITNTTPLTFNKNTTPLTWKIDGSLYMAKGLDTTTWIGTVDKTLTNSTNTLILGGTPQNTTKILWSLNSSSTITPTFTNSTLGAVVEYKFKAVGNIKKSTVSNVGYKIETSVNGPDNNACVRQFYCSPDRAVVSYTPSLQTFTNVISEYHPFVAGVLTCTISTEDEPRTIDFKGLSDGCDNSGVITIKNISYPVDFKR